MLDRSVSSPGFVTSPSSRGPDSIVSTSGRKRYEDSLEALVCIWVGAKYFEGEAVPYRDGIGAIWMR